MGLASCLIDSLETILLITSFSYNCPCLCFTFTLPSDHSPHSFLLKGWKSKLWISAAGQTTQCATGEGASLTMPLVQFLEKMGWGWDVSTLLKYNFKVYISEFFFKNQKKKISNIFFNTINNFGITKGDENQGKDNTWFIKCIKEFRW